MDERLGDLPDDQPYVMTTGEARAYKETLKALRDAITAFGEIKLQTISICHVVSEALQNPDPSVVHRATVVDALQYAEILDVFNGLNAELEVPEDNGGG